MRIGEGNINIFYATIRTFAQLNPKKDFFLLLSMLKKFLLLLTFLWKQ